MRAHLRSVLVALASVAGAAVAPAADATTIVGGNIINQTWTPAGSPYVVQGDITVPAGAFLTIQAGTVVQLAGSDAMASGLDTSRIELTVNGTLTVSGTAASPVTFQAQSGTGANIWYGIVAGPTATSVSIQGAVVQNAYQGLATSAPSSAVQVQGSTFQACTSGLFVQAGAPTFDAITVTSSTYGLYQTGGTAAVTHSVLRSNTYGVYSYIVSGTSSLNVVNSTLHGNSYGVYASNVSGSSTVAVRNSIVSNNSSYGIFRGGTNTVTVTYSDVWGNGTNYSGASAGAGCISANPLHVAAPGNLRLTSNSPARFGGDDGADQGALPYGSDPTPGLYGTLWDDAVLVAGTWTIPGDLTVAPGKSLVIDAGAVVQLASTDLMASGLDPSRIELTVLGSLTVSGTTQAPVTFGAQTGSGAALWYGIVAGAPATSVSIQGALVKNAYQGLVTSATSPVQVQDSTFQACTYGLFVQVGTPTFDAITVTSSTYGFYQAGGTATVVNAVLRSNTYGVYSYITFGASSLNVVNSTLHGNSYGVYASNGVSSSTVAVTNSIVSNNSSYGIFRGGTSTVNVTYSDVWGNGTNYSGASAGAGSISANPLYVAPPADLTLQASSFCIDGGTSTGAPDHDRNGAPRPLNGSGLGALWDMGAYEYGPFCGDGVVNGTEACDDGGLNGTYGHCNSACTGLGPRCGDGAVNGPETCDDGGLNGTYGHCNSACTGLGPRCGDGAVNGPETCDDGGLNGSYGHCNSTCTGPGPSCGDGIVNGPETCDDGGLNGSYGHCNSTCTGPGPSCGDGTVNGPETCDDGGQNGTYGHCNSTCTGPGPFCGDGTTNGAELCDDAALNGTYGHCKADCTGPGPSCGDGIPNGPEVCDDGIQNGTYGHCKADCTGPGPSCGDGVVNGTETCDDGAQNGTYGHCQADCSGPGPSCGDGIVNGPEQCDDGNHVNGDGCDSQCRKESAPRDDSGSGGCGCAPAGRGASAGQLAALLGVLLAVPRRRGRAGPAGGSGERSP